MKWVWIFFSLIIIVSMIFVYSGGFRVSQSRGGSQTPPTSNVQQPSAGVTAPTQEAAGTDAAPEPFEITIPGTGEQNQ